MACFGVDAEFFSQGRKTGFVSTGTADAPLVRIEVKGRVGIAVFVPLWTQTPGSVLVIAESLYRCPLT